METEINEIKELNLNAQQLILLSNLYLHKDYPHCFLTLKQASIILERSRTVVKELLNDMFRKGYVTRVRAYVTFYYPVKNDEVRNQLLQKFGIR